MSGTKAQYDDCNWRVARQELCLQIRPRRIFVAIALLGLANMQRPMIWTQWQFAIGKVLHIRASESATMTKHSIFFCVSDY